MWLPRNILALVLFIGSTLALRATLGPALQMQLGNPSGATADAANRANFLIQRAQYAMSYNDGTREANWVAWDLTSTDVGGSGRSDFVVDSTLPAGFRPVLTTDYSGSGFDRGHMCPSGDRTVTAADNQFTFYMSNMVPQAPDNNQGVWASFESYCRSLASAGNEVLIISGPSGFAGSTLTTGVAIPGYVWKIAVVVPLVPGSPGSALSRITASTRVIALRIPNIQGIRSNPWQNYITSAAQIEADTGYTFFTEVPAAVASVLRSKVDGQSAVGSPAIVTQPETQSSGVGGTVTFTVAATGDAPLAYQWLKDDVELPGATQPSLTVANVQAASAGTYVVTVTNGVGSVASNPAALIVTGLPPSIVTPVAPLTAPAGTSPTLAVVAAGSPPLAYQWKRENIDLPGATLSTLTLPDVQAVHAGNYSVVVSNSINAVTSGPALLTVTPSAPTILTHPASQTVTGGTVVTFSVAARGSADLTYRWRRNTTVLGNDGVVSGATTPTLTLTNVSAADAGNYDVEVTNAVGTAYSNAAVLTVNAATVTWTFNADATTATANPTSGLPVDLTGGTLSQGNNNGTTTLLTTTSASPTANGFSGGFNAGAAARVGAYAAGTSAYFEFTLTPDAGKKLSVTGLSFGSRSTGTGPQAYSLYCSFDGFSVPLATGPLLADSNWRVISPAAFTGVTSTTGAPLTFRLFGHSGTGTPAAGTANWRIDDLKVNVSTAVASAAIAPSVISTSPVNGTVGAPVTTPITVTFNQPVLINGPWFTLTSLLGGPIAATVTGGPTTFTLTPPANFLYGDTITVTVLAGKVVEKDTGTLALPANVTFTFGTGLPVKPTITLQPGPQTVPDGGAASFTVAATGTAPLTYQWRRNTVPLVGNASASTPTLSLPVVALADFGSYDCVVSNAAGSVASDAALLTVTAVAPAITQQPASTTVPIGGTATFAVQASGSAPLTYGWYREGQPLADGAGVSGASTATLTLAGVQALNAGRYHVTVTNSVNQVTSQTAVLGVTAASLAPIVWDFATAAPTSGLPASLTGGVVTQNNNNGTTTLLTAVSVSPTASGFSGGNNAGAAARVGALNPATSAFFEFTLAPSAGRQLVATGLSFGSRSTGTGPQAFAVFSSVDGFTAPLASGSLPANTNWVLQTPAFAGVRGAPGAPVTFRIFGYNGAGSPGTGTANWRIDDLKLTAGTELPPAIAGTVPAAGAADVPVSSSIAVTFNQPVVPGATWFTLTSAARGPVAATVSGGPSVFTLTPVSALAYNDTVTLTVLAGGVRDLSGTLPLPANQVISFTTAAPLPPTIVTPPQAQTATVGDTVTFKIVVTGTAPFTYQWRKNGAAITGNASALTDTLTLKGVLTSAAGDYSCDVTNIVRTITSSPAHLTVNKALATVQLSGLSYVYDGSAKSATVTTTPDGLATTVTYQGLSALPVNAGSYAVVATVQDDNYLGSASGSLVIAPAPAEVILSGLRQPYDGTPKAVTVTTVPAQLPVAISYAGDSQPPAAPGAYPVTATVTDSNYTGSASGTLLIGTTALVRRPPVIAGGVDGSIQMLLGEDLSLGGGAWVSGDVLVPGTPSVRTNGRPTFAGVKDGTGAATPSDYRVTLSGNAVLRYLVRRTDPVALPVLPPSGMVAGTRNLDLDTSVASTELPPGAYGAVKVSGTTELVLGIAGSTVPSSYRLRSLALSGNAHLVVAGPVILQVVEGFTVTGSVSQDGPADWLVIRSGGNVNLHGPVTLRAQIVAPTSRVTLDGGSTLLGTVVSDELVIGGTSQLTAAPE